MANVQQRMVTIAAGAGFTSIRSVIPAHYVKIYEDGDRLKDLEYRLPNDSFTAVYRTKEGDPIELLGSGRSGLIGIPPGYNASGVPALGTELIQIRTQDISGTTVVVYESASEL